MSETCAMFVEVFAELSCRVYANKTELLDGQVTLKNKVGNCNNTVEHKET